MTKNQLKTWAACLFATGALVACGPSDIQSGDLNVIPLPQEVTETVSAEPFVVRSSTTICYPAGNEKLERTAHFLASYIKEVNLIRRPEAVIALYWDWTPPSRRRKVMC